jgi:hypothetical protein
VQTDDSVYGFAPTVASAVISGDSIALPQPFKLDSFTVTGTVRGARGDDGSAGEPIKGVKVRDADATAASHFWVVAALDIDRRLWLCSRSW